MKSLSDKSTGDMSLSEHKCSKIIFSSFKDCLKRENRSFGQEAIAEFRYVKSKYINVRTIYLKVENTRLSPGAK